MRGFNNLHSELLTHLFLRILFRTMSSSRSSIINTMHIRWFISFKLMTTGGGYLSTKISLTNFYLSNILLTFIHIFVRILKIIILKRNTGVKKVFSFSLFFNIINR